LLKGFLFYKLFFRKKGFLNRLIVQCNGFIQKDQWQKSVGISKFDGLVTKYILPNKINSLKQKDPKVYKIFCGLIIFCANMILDLKILELLVFTIRR